MTAWNLKCCLEFALWKGS